MTPEELGNLLKHARATAGISQRELNRRMSKVCGVRTEDNSTIHRWEKGENLRDKATFFTALELCGFDVTVRRTAPE